MDAGARSQAAVRALLGTAVGDAVGAPLEGGPPRALRAARRAVEEARARPRPLPYTDDTQLAWLLLEHLAGGEFDEDRWVRLLTERIEAWRGYAGGMLRLVDLWRDGVDWREAATAVFAEGSFGNGAAMRVAPLGAVHADDAATVTHLARRQARVTHAHPVGMDAAVVQARAAALAARRQRFGRDELRVLADVAATGELAAALADAVGLTARAVDRPDGLDDEVVRTAAERLGTEVVAHRSVPLALWIAAHADDVPAAVTVAVAAGGDVDTIAAMAAAVRAVADGEGSVPADWLAAIEDGPGLAARAERLAAAITGR